MSSLGAPSLRTEIDNVMENLKQTSVIPYIEFMASVQKVFNFIENVSLKCVIKVYGGKGQGKTTFIKYILDKYRTFPDKNYTLSEYYRKVVSGSELRDVVDSLGITDVKIFELDQNISTDNLNVPFLDINMSDVVSTDAIITIMYDSSPDLRKFISEDEIRKFISDDLDIQESKIKVLSFLQTTLEKSSDQIMPQMTDNYVIAKSLDSSGNFSTGRIQLCKLDSGILRNYRQEQFTGIECQDYFSYNILEGVTNRLLPFFEAYSEVTEQKYNDPKKHKKKRSRLFPDQTYYNCTSRNSDTRQSFFWSLPDFLLFLSSFNDPQFSSSFSKPNASENYPQMIISHQGNMLFTVHLHDCRKIEIVISRLKADAIRYVPVFRGQKYYGYVFPMFLTAYQTFNPETQRYEPLSTNMLVKDFYQYYLNSRLEQLPYLFDNEHVANSSRRKRGEHFQDLETNKQNLYFVFSDFGGTLYCVKNRTLGRELLHVDDQPVEAFVWLIPTYTEFVKTAKLTTFDILTQFSLVKYFTFKNHSIFIPIFSLGSLALPMALVFAPKDSEEIYSLYFKALAEVYPTLYARIQNLKFVSDYSPEFMKLADDLGIKNHFPSLIHYLGSFVGNSRYTGEIVKIMFSHNIETLFGCISDLKNKMNRDRENGIITDKEYSLLESTVTSSEVLEKRLQPLCYRRNLCYSNIAAELLVRHIKEDIIKQENSDIYSIINKIALSLKSSVTYFFNHFQKMVSSEQKDNIAKFQKDYYMLTGILPDSPLSIESRTTCECEQATANKVVLGLQNFCKHTVDDKIKVNHKSLNLFPTDLHYSHFNEIRQQSKVTYSSIDVKFSSFQLSGDVFMRPQPQIPVEAFRKLIPVSDEKLYSFIDIFREFVTDNLLDVNEINTFINVFITSAEEVHGKFFDYRIPNFLDDSVSNQKVKDNLKIYLEKYIKLFKESYFEDCIYDSPFYINYSHEAYQMELYKTNESIFISIFEFLQDNCPGHGFANVEDLKRHIMSMTYTDVFSSNFLFYKGLFTSLFNGNISEQFEVASCLQYLVIININNSFFADSNIPTDAHALSGAVVLSCDIQNKVKEYSYMKFSEIKTLYQEHMTRVVIPDYSLYTDEKTFKFFRVHGLSK